MVAHTRSQVSDLQIGSLWADISPRGGGEVVKIKRIGHAFVGDDHVPVTVRYLSQGKGKDPSQTFSMDVETFLSKHMPVKPAKHPAARVNPRPMPRDPRMSNVFSPQTRLNGQKPTFDLEPTSDGAAVPEILPSSKPPYVRFNPNRSLTEHEAREIFLLKDSGDSASEVGRVYGIGHTTVLAIWRGKRYQEVTAALRAGTPQQPTAEEPPKEEPQVDVVTQELACEKDEPRPHLRHPRPLNRPIRPIEQAAATVSEEAKNLNAVVEQILRTRQEGALTPPPLAEKATTSDQDREAILLLSEAVLLLLDSEGRLSPFLKLDKEAIRRTAIEARQRVGE